MCVCLCMYACICVLRVQYYVCVFVYVCMYMCLRVQYYVCVFVYVALAPSPQHLIPLKKACGASRQEIHLIISPVSHWSCFGRGKPQWARQHTTVPSQGSVTGYGTASF